MVGVYFVYYIFDPYQLLWIENKTAQSERRLSVFEMTSTIEVRFLGSGEMVAMLGPEEFLGRCCESVKKTLAPFAGVSRFRQILFREDDVILARELEMGRSLQGP